jgi:ABC-2 type transport system ATP-binding protein
LLHRPQVLFLDEPSRGLDPISAREIRETIVQLSREGMTILLTTHLMDEADQLCQRVAFQVGGKIVANDTPRNLKVRHGRRTLRVLLSQKDGTVKLVEKRLSLDAVEDQARLTQWMREGLVSAIHSDEATLEEVFIEVAGVRPA